MSASFFHKKNQNKPAKRVCFRLKEIRKAKGVSVREIAAKTKISQEQIIALEECRFADLKCSGLYQKNFVKKYVEALGINPASFLRQYCEEEMNNIPALSAPVKLDFIHLRNLPAIFRYSLVILITLGVAFYLGTQIKNTLNPPVLVVSSPADGLITNQNTIDIMGYSQPEVTLQINGQAISSAEDGNFQKTLNLSPGVNTVVITAANKHGKTSQETRHIIYKQPMKFSLKNLIDS